jgi:response regulator RpfG family c-di-GMP phosphodiesterase
MIDSLPVADPALPRVLCVDDDANLLAALRRALHRRYDFVGVENAADALAAVKSGPPFAVAVADLHLPSMNGTRLLIKLREATPDTVRLLLTGTTDLRLALTAVNEGQLFGVLQKPCMTSHLLATLDSAVERYRVLRAERVLMEETFQGLVEGLIDILALSNPVAFGRASRLKRSVAGLAARVAYASRWEAEVAALVSQVGSVAHPAGALDGDDAASNPAIDARTALAQAAIVDRLLANVPRLNSVREILRYQHARFDGRAAQGVPADAPVRAGEDIPMGARMLKIAGDFDLLETRGMAPLDATAKMWADPGPYDPALLAHFVDLLAETGSEYRLMEMNLDQVEDGMILTAPVLAVSGVCLVARGQRVTPSLLERIRHHWSDFASTLRVQVQVPDTLPRPIFATEHA